MVQKLVLRRKIGVIKPDVDQKPKGGVDVAKTPVKEPVAKKGIIGNRRRTISAEPEKTDYSGNGIVFVHMDATDVEGVNPLLVDPKSISFLVRVDGKDIERQHFVLDIGTDTTEDAIGYFLSTLETYPGIRVVSYCGRSFLFPRINMVGMKAGLSGMKMFQTGDRYNGYMTRYSDRYHLDLADAITANSAPTPKLDDAFHYITGESPDDTDGLGKIIKLYDRWNAYRNN